MFSMAVLGLCLVPGAGLRVCRSSDNGPLRGRQVDGLDANGQRSFQRLQGVRAGAFRRRVVQQLFERLQLDQDHHVLQEVALDVRGQVWSIKEL